MFRDIIIATATIAIATQTVVATALTGKAAVNNSKIKQQYGRKVATSKEIPANRILAKIGSDTIRQSDFELFLQNFLNDQQRLQLQCSSEAKEQILNYFLRLRIMTAKAQKDRLQDKPMYTSKIAVARMQILAQSLMDRDSATIETKAAITDEEIKSYFSANQEKFRTPEMFSARHILVSNKNKTANGEITNLTNEEMQAKISKIQDELKLGKSFADVAREYSDDPGSKDNGGLYEDIAFGSFATEFEQAVRKQEINKIGDPVKTQYGCHLIEARKIIPATTKTFEESKETAKELAIAERKNLEIEKYFDSLKKEIGYKKFEHNISNSTNAKS